MEGSGLCLSAKVPSTEQALLILLAWIGSGSVECHSLK